jgi:glucoamylase
MQWSYTLAENGNVALTGEIDLQATGGSFEIAIGFGRNESEAGQRALTSLHAGFAPALETYIAQWSEWFASLEHPVDGDGKGWLSTAVIRAHEDKEFRGGIIASLSIPWGQAKGDDDLGGYHLVWARDLVEAAGGLLAAGATDDVRRVLEYLRATQEADGHWPQNMWLDGDPFWPGIQMDEAAFPVLLLDLACREKVLDAASLRSFMPMVRRAAGYIVRNGPVTGQDRWEEDAGYAPFTLAVEIAALVVAANFLEDAGELVPAGYLRETALYWNACIERWCYVQGSDTARQLGIDGYYVRIAPPEVGEASSPAQGFVPIKNRPANESIAPASRIISTDALALVRFGLRAPDDPRILNTVRAIDRLLMVETPSGPAWHRYNQDGYGEHEDGRPFDGTGIGRAWPLLTGERAHYELRAGNVKRARDLLAALSSFGSEVGLLPEQTWDAKDIPERELFVGRPAGSAMPLVWAHAEHVKLLRSLSDGRVFDAPSDEVGKLFRSCRPPAWVPWRFNNKCREIPEGKDLRIELPGTALVRWTSDHWQTVREVPTRTTTLGIEYCDIPTGSLSAVSTTEFTFLWTEGDRWEGRDYSVLIRPPHPNE